MISVAISAFFQKDFHKVDWSFIGRVSLLPSVFLFPLGCIRTGLSSRILPSQQIKGPAQSVMGVSLRMGISHHLSCSTSALLFCLSKYVKGPWLCCKFQCFVLCGEELGFFYCSKERFVWATGVWGKVLAGLKKWMHTIGADLALFLPYRRVKKK